MDKNEKNPAMPALPGHPEPFAMAWTELELREIEEYGVACWDAGHAAAPTEIPAHAGTEHAQAALSDEQIIEIATTTRSAEANKDGGYILPISFARAILSASQQPTTAPAEQAQGQAAEQGDGQLLVMLAAINRTIISLRDGWGDRNDANEAISYIAEVKAALAQRAGSAKPSPSEGPVVDMTEALLTEDEEDALYESIRMKLESHRMVRMFDIEEDGSLGNSHHLIDRLSLDASDISGADISTGKEEIESIIDTVFNGAKEYAMSIIAKRIHDRACTCWKCLAEFESAKPSEQAEAQSKAGVSVDTPTIWSMSPALGVMVPNSPRQANREQFYAVDEANAHTARAVAEALEGQLTEMGPRGALYLPQAWPDAWHALRDDVLSGVDGLDNDQINIVLGMLDNYEPVATIQPSQPAGAVQERWQWTPGPDEFKDWCTQYFGPDADETYLAEAVFKLPPMAQRFDTTPSAAVQSDSEEDAYSAIRLRLLADSLGLSSSLPKENSELWACRFAALGIIRSGIEKLKQSVSERDAALTDAARDVLAERLRQIEREGFSYRRDDNYLKRDLAFAAASYVLYDNKQETPWCWPWDERWWNPQDGRRNLVKAGALILAEIERTDRAAIAAAVPQTKEG